MSQNRQTVAIVAIGTEITSGQIIDTNSAWLSQALTDLRYDVALHLSVRDDEKDILAALQYAATQGSFLIVTGGLGPTSDDKTRLVLASWAGQPLVFDGASWQHIENRLNGLGVPVAPSNRQQAMFPSGARVITNRQGTANAFYLEAFGHRVWSLPGPPHEIQGLWRDTLAEEFRALNPDGQAQRLSRYHMLGISESRLGEIVEDAVAGSRLVTGYRPHAPYVEVKIWCELVDWAEQQVYIQRLEKVLSPWLINRDDEDLATDFAQILAASAASLIVDHLSHGFLDERLAPALRRLTRAAVTILTDHGQGFEEPSDGGNYAHVLTLSPFAPDGTWQVTWRGEDGNVPLQETLRLPFPYTPDNRDRLRKIAIELSLRAFINLTHQRRAAHG